MATLGVRNRRMEIVETEAITDLAKLASRTNGFSSSSLTKREQAYIRRDTFAATANNGYHEIVKPKLGSRKPYDSITPEVMTIEDLARYLQLSKSSLYKLAQGGRIPGHKVGRHWRFHKDTIDEWLKQGSKETSE